MAKSEIRRLLTGKTDWNRKALSARVQRLRAVTPMTTPVAQAVLAHQHGIRVDRYLDEGTLAEVRRVLSLINLAGSISRGPERASARNGNQVARVTRTAKSSVRSRSIHPHQFEYSDPILPEAKLTEAREMASVYPMLYVLENSMRELINRVMSGKYGNAWWDTELTSGRAKVVKNNADLRRQGENHRRWHQRRGAQPIDYTDLSDLGALLLARQADFFPDVLGGEEARRWVEHLMLELEPSRHVVCHMNPLSPDNVELVRIRLAGWRSLLDGRIDYIPPAVKARRP